VFFDQYLAGHSREAEMMKSMPFPDAGRLMMVLTGPMVGVVSGIIIGIFAVIAGKLIQSATPVGSSPASTMESTNQGCGRLLAWWVA
jgi:hypothetical protein